MTSSDSRRRVRRFPSTPADVTTGPKHLQQTCDSETHSLFHQFKDLLENPPGDLPFFSVIPEYPNSNSVHSFSMSSSMSSSSSSSSSSKDSGGDTLYNTNNPVPPVISVRDVAQPKREKLSDTRKVAYKVLKDPDFSFMFFTEASALRDLGQHPNICTIYGIDYHPRFDRWALQLEPCLDGTLLDAVQTYDCLPEKVAAPLFAQLCSAIAYAHNCGYSHRDIKLDNIMLVFKSNYRRNRHSSSLTQLGSQRAVLVDWGLATRIETHKAIVPASNCGTTQYMAPELLLNMHHRDTQLDVWALGVVLYTMTTGFFPYAGSTREEVIESLNDPLIFDNDESSEFKHLVMNMLAKDPLIRLRMIDIVRHPWFIKNKTRVAW
eukprot:CAMPEP_0201551374 /NCGR_PEP_ID=MMETSP0173_2-20130828/7562_1 /ASSEMBLY_ACC=CAM_ASM_000268 /TAXON_ID=218659 /ORGANISM="Vexillifera sp., Strain DIVA3 564/2" /LENGTH=376 /DNA_ID=CAMNT_0047961605 /DNA_START=452 /DNA_END=1579 /DNA_ORIENTATION=+